MTKSTLIYRGSGFRKTCPNCGAAIEGEKCQYCGTVFIDFACIDANKPFYMKIKFNDEIFVVKAALKTMDTINSSPHMIDVSTFDDMMKSTPKYVSGCRGAEEFTMTFIAHDVVGWECEVTK